MNIALEKTEEYVNGVKRRTYGDAFIRGNNGMSALIRSISCVFFTVIRFLCANSHSHVYLCRLIARVSSAYTSDSL